ncbi:MAG TPA: GNAT family N-acetyltransferase [Ktedonobacteraceae bacterium]|jgi:predicted N-acetyltransferase YhbS|nr:GNAT family N-acetyltransferase [Ktedonobacteraceae bacterium]
MKNLTASADFVIRSPQTAEEIEHYFRLNAETFRPDEDTVLVASRRRRFIEYDPDFQMIQLRSTFYGKTYVGSYRIQERWLCVESSRLSIGCIGGVVIDQDYRHQGVATAMMQDALAFAQNRQYSFLLLDGIPDYYQQHGFIDVIEDMPQHAVRRELIPDQPSEQCFVRVAELSDAAHLLALYVEHNRDSICTFAPSRTAARQVHYLKNWPEEHLPLLAFNKDGKLEGYLLLSSRRGQFEAFEVAANTWPAVLALLHYQNTLNAGELASQTEVSWPLPLTDITSNLLADHLPLRSEINIIPDGGWMARMVSFSAVVQTLLPLWEERWLKHQSEWTGVLALVVDEERCTLELTSSTINRFDRLIGEEQEVRFSQQVFTQLVFGFRPVTWAAIQAGQRVPDELVPILDVLFPHKQSWIAGSDYF